MTTLIWYGKVQWGTLPSTQEKQHTLPHYHDSTVKPPCQEKSQNNTTQETPHYNPTIQELTPTSTSQCQNPQTHTQKPENTIYRNTHDTRRKEGNTQEQEQSQQLHQIAQSRWISHQQPLVARHTRDALRTTSPSRTRFASPHASTSPATEDLFPPGTLHAHINPHSTRHPIQIEETGRASAAPIEQQKDHPRFRRPPRRPPITPATALALVTGRSPHAARAQEEPSRRHLQGRPTRCTHHSASPTCLLAHRPSIPSLGRDCATTGSRITSRKGTYITQKPSQERQQANQADKAAR